FGTASRDTALQRRNDRSSYLVLNSEDILNVAVIALRPEVALGDGIDQLRRDADAAACLAHTPLHNVAHTQRFSHSRDVDGGPAEVEGRIAGDDAEGAIPREPDDDVFGDAVGEIPLLWIVASVLER